MKTKLKGSALTSSRLLPNGGNHKHSSLLPHPKIGGKGYQKRKYTFQNSSKLVELLESRSQLKEVDPNGRDASRSPRRKAETAPTQLDEQSSQPSCEDKTHTILASTLPLDPDSALLQGWVEKDVGGSGDCGYRAIAAARHRIKTGEFLTKETAKTEGAELLCGKQTAKSGRALHLQASFLTIQLVLQRKKDQSLSF